MARLIDADAVAENLMDSCWFDCDDIDIALQAVKLTDTIDPESLRPHGKWVKDQFSYRYLCTNCKMTLPEWMGVFNYCPCCGAKMED